MTICVVLVASVDSQLEQEILDAGSEYQHLAGLPKALLPVSGGKRVLDYWWTAIESQRQISDVYLVTNAKSFKHFERWATARGLPSQNVVNDGTGMPEPCGHGSVRRPDGMRCGLRRRAQGGLGFDPGGVRDSPAFSQGWLLRKSSFANEPSAPSCLDQTGPRPPQRSSVSGSGRSCS